jgi:NADH-quinone oxidoreductase subunit N
MYLWQPLFLLSSFGSLVIGSFGIIGQNRIKRLMAYSSINHVSFLLLGMACGNLTGLCITILYLLVYSLTLLIFFGFVLNARCLLTARPLIYLSDFAKLAQFSTWGSQGLLIILFSMGGLPPLAGFFVKFYIYIEAISSSFYIFVFFSLVISIISTFYYLFFLKSILFDKNL